MSIDSIRVSQQSYQNHGAQGVKPEIRVREEAIHVEPIRESAIVKIDNITGRDTEHESSFHEQALKNANSEAIKKAINELNKSNPNSIVQFGVHEETNRMTIKILDKDSRKVMKEFPAEKTLDLIAKAWELAGFMVDEIR